MTPPLSSFCFKQVCRLPPPESYQVFRFFCHHALPPSLISVQQPFFLIAVFCSFFEMMRTHFVEDRKPTRPFLSRYNHTPFCLSSSSCRVTRLQGMTSISMRTRKARIVNFVARPLCFLRRTVMDFRFFSMRFPPSSVDLLRESPLFHYVRSFIFFLYFFNLGFVFPRFTQVFFPAINSPAKNLFFRLRNPRRIAFSPAAL